MAGRETWAASWVDAALKGEEAVAVDCMDYCKMSTWCTLMLAESEGSHLDFSPAHCRFGSP